MQQVIIYKRDSGNVTILYPADWAVEKYGVNAVAQKDVPAGKPYKIVDAADIPTDRSQRNAWTVDDADLTDGIGGESSEFPEAP